MSDRPLGVLGHVMPEEVGGPISPLTSGPYLLVIPVRYVGLINSVLTNPSTHAIEEVRKIEVRMVCQEGVAYKVMHDKPWRWNDYLPSARFWSMWELIAKIDETTEANDLAYWVRSFGSRLESNFHQIHYWATKSEED